MKRIEFDEQAYARRSRSGPCFICRMLAGDEEFRHEVVYRDEQHVVFLDRYPTLLGKLLVAPVAHRRDVIGDFTAAQSAALWHTVHRAGAALQQVVPTERIYLQSLGSHSGNSHVHIHVAALPPGVPYEQQQTAALLWESAGLLDVPTEETARIAARLRAALAAPPAAEPSADGPAPAVREFTEQAVGRIASWTDVSWARPGSRVWRATGAEGGQWYVKIHRGARFHQREVRAYRTWVPGLGAATPRLVAVDADLSAVVVTALPGRPLHGAVHPPEQQRAIFHQVGALAAAIHRPAPAAGPDDTLSAALEKMERHLDAARTHLAPGDADFVRLADLWAGRPDLLEALTDGYGRTFTTAELEYLTVLEALDAVSGIQYGAAAGDPELLERGLRTLTRLRATAEAAARREGTT
ncbi:phosphotransferase [Kitasatospora phosalacinea]|uniref:phosphotransferase n=1 Tax=Kitasatospora phosalacinea TaxID=2065 RepID=UPI0035D5DAAF